MAVALTARSAPCFCISVLFIGIFVGAAVQLAAFIPLYTPVECRQLPGGLGTPAMDLAWVNLTSALKQECRNPNPYAIHTSQRRLGQVFVKEGSELKPVGQTNMPATELAAHGKLVGEGVMEVALPIAEAAALMAQPLFQMVIQTYTRTESHPHFFGIAMASSKDSDDICGFEVRMATGTVGPMLCAATLDELVIPDVDAELEVQRVQLAEEFRVELEMQRDAAFGSILAISFLGAAVSMALGVRRARAQCKAKDAKTDSNIPQGSSECEGEKV